jgi:hypothetical protein
MRALAAFLTSIRSISILTTYSNFPQTKMKVDLLLVGQQKDEYVVTLNCKQHVYSSSNSIFIMSSTVEVLEFLRQVSQIHPFNMIL